MCSSELSRNDVICIPLSSSKLVQGTLRLRFTAEIRECHIDGAIELKESRLPERCPIWPRFYERLFSSLIRLESDTSPSNLEYEFFEIRNSRALGVQDGGEGGEDESGERAIKRRLLVDLSAQPLPESPSYVKFGFPKNLSRRLNLKARIHELTNSLLPPSSILFIITSLVSGVPFISYPPSLEELKILMHAINWYSRLNLPGLARIASSQLSYFFRECHSQIDYFQLLPIIWAECDQNTSLLQLVVSHQRSLSHSSTENEKFARAFANRIGSLSTLNMDVFLDFIFAIKTGEAMKVKKVHSEDEIKDPPIEQNFRIYGTPSKSSVSNDNVKEEAPYVMFSEELLYAQWPLFRELHDSNAQDMVGTKSLKLPLSFRALEALRIHLSEIPEPVRLSRADCFSILLHGRECGLFSSIESENDKIIISRSNLELFVFNRLVWQSVGLIFSERSMRPIHIYQSLLLAHLLQLGEQKREMLDYIISNDRALRSNSAAIEFFATLPMELKADVAMYRYSHVI